jgi:exodeoxyribonuclease VIII
LPGDVGVNQQLKMAETDYFQLPLVNHSRLKLMKESPWHYQHPPKQRKPSADFVIGSAFHALLLEPEIFAQRYVPTPVMSKNSNAYKEMARAMDEKGQIPLDADQWAKIHSMREAVIADPYVGGLFEQGEAEQTLLFTDPITGLEGKARVDWLPTHFPNVLVDLKTTKSGNPDSLKKSCWDYGYYTQAAFYRWAWEVVMGIAPQAFLFVFVEKPDDPEDTPLPPQLYELDATYQRLGEKHVREWLNEVHRCQREYGDQPWPHYTNGLSELSPPHMGIKKP